MLWRSAVSRLRPEFEADARRDLRLFGIVGSCLSRDIAVVGSNSRLRALNEGRRCFATPSGDDWREGKPLLWEEMRTTIMGRPPALKRVFWKKLILYGTDRPAVERYLTLAREAWGALRGVAEFDRREPHYAAAWTGYLLHLASIGDPELPLAYEEWPWSKWARDRWHAISPVRLRLVQDVFSASVAALDWLVERKGRTKPGPSEGTGDNSAPPADRPRPETSPAGSNTQVVSDNKDCKLPTPGFLGLIVDKGQKRVSREGCPKTVEFGGYDLRWHLFHTLFKGGERRTAAESLYRVWSECGLQDTPEQGRLHSELSFLRKHLKPLGIVVSNKRKLGWRLEDARENLVV